MTVIQRIKNCKEIKKSSRRCSRYNGLPVNKKPLLQKKIVRNKIMLITQAPSKQAHLSGNLNNMRNDFFKKMIELIGITEKEFQKKAYWTHYCKCYPGRAIGGDKIPNKVCAEKYLLDEIEHTNPKCLILMGGRVIKYLLYKKLPDAIKSNLEKYPYPNDRFGIPVIATLHFSNSARYLREKYYFAGTLKLIKKCIKKDCC